MSKWKIYLLLPMFAVLAFGSISFAQEIDRDALKAELRAELKAELKKELLGEIKEEMKAEILSETKADVQEATEEATLGLRDVMRTDFKAEIRAEIMEETKGDISSEIAKVLGDTPVLGGMFKGITVGGFVDTNFSYNFRQAGEATSENGGDINGLNFIGENEDNSFTFESFAMWLDKAVTEEDPIGWQLHTYWGEKAKRITFLGERAGVVDGSGASTSAGGTDDVARNDLFTVATANITWKAPVLGKHIDITMGKFYTWIGYELVENIGNPNYSHGMVYNNAIPFTHTGLSFDVSEFIPSDKFGLKLFYVNGWDSFVDNNESKSGGWYLTYQPNDDLFMSLGGIHGNEGWGKKTGDTTGFNVTSRNNNGLTQMFDFVATYSLPQVDKLSLGANFDWGIIDDFTAHDANGNGIVDTGAVAGTPKEAVTSARWWAAVGYLMYDFTDAQQGAFRYEYFDDTEGARSFGDSFWDITYTQNMKVRENLLLRPEVRYIRRNGEESDHVKTGGASAGDTVADSEFIFTFGAEYVF